jgi:hypothetical protein
MDIRSSDAIKEPNRYDPLPRVAVRLGIDAELQGTAFPNTRFLLKLASRGLLDGLVLADKSPWECPTASEGLLATLYQKDAELTAYQRENSGIRRDCRVGKFITV